MKTRCFRLLMAVLPLVLVSNAQAVTPQELLGTQQSEQILREEQQRLQRLERDRMLEELERSLQVIPVPTPERKQFFGEASQVCFTIHSIELRGADNLLKSEKQKLVAPYLKQCLGLNDIDALRIEIDRFYINKGWIMSRAYLEPNQNIKSGVLIFRVLEGRLDGIDLNENDKSERRQIATAFPGMVDEVINIRDIEQGLEQINRLDSNRATMSIAPAKDRPGYSKMIINNKIFNPYRLTLGYDNQGSESTGEERAKLMVDMDNLLSVNDSWYVVATESTDSDKEERDSSSYSLNAAIPYGYWTYGISFNHSEYLSTVDDGTTPFTVTGNSDIAGLKVSRVVHRGKSAKTLLSGTLNIKDTESFLEDVKLETSTRRLTTFDLGVMHVLRKPGAIWSFSLSHLQGLDAFDALQDSPNTDNTIPRAQFEMLRWDISSVLSLPSLGKRWSYQGTWFGQQSRDPLFGSEQLVIGSSYTVRGFRDSPVTGDSGLYFKNDVKWKVPDGMRLLRGLTISGGLDVGMVSAKNDNIANSGESKAALAGMAVGLQQVIKFSKRQRLSWSLVLSKALSAPSFVDKESNVVYFDLSWKAW